MARDYVRKRPQKKQSNLPRQLLFIIVSFISGYLTASFVDIKTITAWINTHLTKETTTAKKELKTPIKKAEQPKPKFEFYTLLAKDSNPQVLPNRPGAAEPRALANNVQKSPLSQTTNQSTPPTPAVKPGVASTSSVAVVESKPITPNPANKESYSVQIASFNRRADAEQLKASLVLRGYDVFIGTTMKGQTTWYRVILGPYANRNLAEKAQTEVARTERMRGMIRRMEG